MKIKKNIKNTVILALLGTLIQFLLTTYTIPRMNLDVIIKSITEGSALQNPIEILVLIILWVMIGLFIYIIYISIDETYEHLKELFIYEATFTNKRKNTKPQKPNKHVLLYILSTVSYIILFSLLVFMIYPASVKTQNYFFSLFQNNFSEKITLALSFLPSLILWFLVLLLLNFIIEYFKTKDKEITFKEEHIQN